MRFVLAALIALHGSIHLLGVAKAFGARSLPLQQAISKPLGIVWLLAALCFLLSAALVVLRSELFWVALLPALVVSQGLIFSAFQDAKFGSLANVALLLPISVALLAYRPSSFRSVFARAAESAGAARASLPEHPSDSRCQFASIWNASAQPKARRQTAFVRAFAVRSGAAPKLPGWRSTPSKSACASLPRARSS